MVTKRDQYEERLKNLLAAKGRLQERNISTNWVDMAIQYLEKELAKL